MIFLSLIVIVGQAPTPIEAFRANLAAISAETEFVYSEGITDSLEKNFWDPNGPRFIERPDSIILGRWASDGASEYYSYASAPEILKRARQPKSDGLFRPMGKIVRPVRYVPKVEAILDDGIIVSHAHDPGMHSIEKDSAWKDIDARKRLLGSTQLPNAKGPFRWWLSLGFDELLRREFQGIVPTRRKSTRSGRPVEIEIYEMKMKAGATQRLEVAYDPSIGYLPRFARWIVFPLDNSMFAREMFLTQARRSARGGFVPTEFYTRTAVTGPGSRVANYTDETILDPQSPPTGTRYRAISFQDLKDPVALRELPEQALLVSALRSVPLERSRETLSLADVKASLGNNPDRYLVPNPSAVNIEEQLEINRAEQFNRGLMLGAAGVAVLLILVLFLLRRRKRRSRACRSRD